MKKINALRFVYTEKTFFGNRKLVDDTTTEVTEKNLEKAFNALLKDYAETALWVEFEGFSYGYVFDTYDDMQNRILTVIYSAPNERYETKESMRNVKKQLFGIVRKMKEENR